MYVLQEKIEIHSFDNKLIISFNDNITQKEYMEYKKLLFFQMKININIIYK